MTPASIDYPALLRSSLLGVVRHCLTRTSEEGLPGEHHFYLSFRTDRPDVEISERLRRQYPERMTVVLQHGFEELRVDHESFAVTLRFGGIPARLRVPFDALLSFVDPSAEFGLQFESSTPGADGPVDGPNAPEETPEVDDGASSGEPADADGGRVVSFERARRRHETPRT